MVFATASGPVYPVLSQTSSTARGTIKGLSCFLSFYESDSAVEPMSWNPGSRPSGDIPYELAKGIPKSSREKAETEQLLEMSMRVLGVGCISLKGGFPPYNKIKNYSGGQAMSSKANRR